jgi:hypothetical protein
MKYAMFFIFVLVLIAWTVMRIVYGVGFEMNCSQYLKRAADANAVELAQANLKTAIEYAEREHLTNGIVSIILHQPGNDIGFWYSNLVASQEELRRVTKDTTQMEKSNLLMKLRETLTDNGKEGTSITCPDGISIYPYNTLFFWWIMGGLILTAMQVIWIILEE